MWFIYAVLHSFSCPQSVFLPLQMRNEKLCWDCRNQNLFCTTPFVIQVHKPGASSKIWCLVTDSNASRRKLFLNLMPLKFFQTFRKEMVHSLHIVWQRIVLRIGQSPPMSMTFISIKYWLPFHISSCSNYLVGWCNIKKKLYLLQCVRSAEWT